MGRYYSMIEDLASSNHFGKVTAFQQKGVSKAN